MLKYILYSVGVILLLSGCGGSDESQDTTQAITSEKLSYIPKDIDNSLATRFLNKATFGATSEDIKRVQTLGVAEWLEREFKKSNSESVYLTKMIGLAKQCEPDVNSETIAEYLEDNDAVFNKNKASFHSPRYRMSSWFDAALTEDDQLRHRVAYALSQIIVASDFEPIFTRRAEALARYFDILYKNAFGSYEVLLQDISLNAGMGMFLTYNGNKKLYQNDANISVYPDENYAREVMQLFSIGLNKLNLDGTPQKDADGNLIPTYTQEDVNQLARVFTGWDLQRNRRYGQIGFTRGDLTHPLEFTKKYHDFGAKKLLDEEIVGGLSGKEDMFRAIDIIVKQKSVAPYIAKNLIMRLSKSNPSPAYIKRVATIFQNTSGNLKEVVRAIFLDEELWSDLKSRKIVKFKEPLLAYTQFLRAMKAAPLNGWYFCSYGGPSDDNATNCEKVKDSFLINDTRSFLAQGAGLAPTVFNFYENDYTPNDRAFQESDFHAPELQIQSDTMLINFSNKVRENLVQWERGYILEWHYKDKEDNWHKYSSIDEYIQKAPMVGNIPIYYIGSDKMLLDASDEYNVLEMVIDGDRDGDFKNLQDHREEDYHGDEDALRALIEFENNKLTGGLLSQEEMDVIFNTFKDRIYNKYDNKSDSDHPRSKKYQLYRNIIAPVIRMIVTSDKYMVE